MRKEFELKISSKKFNGGFFIVRQIQGGTIQRSRNIVPNAKYVHIDLVVLRNATFGP